MLSPAAAAGSPLDAWPEQLWSRSRSRHGPAAPRLEMVDPSGHTEVTVLPLDRWHGPIDAIDLQVLARARPPVLDIGCGPGRHVTALAESGLEALGIDVSPGAVDATRSRGGRAERVSVFAEVPNAGRWNSALLLDGNIGIGGDPHLLLRRVARLLADRGSVLVETDPPAVKSGICHARVKHGGEVGPRFAWARVGPDDVEDLARRCGFVPVEVWHHSDRWFARLDRRRRGPAQEGAPR